MSDVKTVRDRHGNEHPVEDVERGMVLDFLKDGQLFKLNVDGTYSPSVPESDPRYGERYRVVMKEAGQ